VWTMGTVHAKEPTSQEFDDIEPETITLEKLPASVEKIHIDGLARTKDDIVVRTVQELFHTKDFGDILMKSNEVKNALEKLGCFKNVATYIDTSDNNNTGYEVTFYVTELRRIMGSVSTLVGNNEGSMVLSLSLPNLAGRGEQSKMEYSYGTRNTSGFNATLVKPLIGKANGSLMFTVFQDGSEVPSSGYKLVNRGGLLQLAFQSAPQVEHKLQLESVWREVTCLNRNTAFAVRKECGHTLKSSIKHILERDTRDAHIIPTRGTLFRLEQELAGLGGDIGFIKNEAELQFNTEIANDVMLQGVLQGGAMSPLQNNKTYSINDKFMLGGPLNLRGFEMFGVGPHSEGAALGSEMYWASGLHVYSRLPLIPPTGGISDLFRVHAFANAGNIGNFQFNDDYQQNLQTLMRGLRISYGVGLILRIGQVARFELNYSIPGKHQPGDRVHAGLQFGVGAQFL